MKLTWPSFNNIRMLMMAFMPVVIFYMVWMVNTSESIRSEEGTLLDLVCWPDGNAIPVIIACGSIIAVVIELYGLHQLYKAGLSRREYNVTNGLFYYIWGLLIMIIIFLAIMFYSGLQSTIIRAKIKGGITKAMLRYASHLPSKVAIDRLQTRFHCCGRVDYHEWFYIEWYTTGNSVDTNSLLSGLQDRKFVADNVPYSCCSMEALYPCIHHSITKPGTIYKYDPTKQLTIWLDGCEEKLIKEMMDVSWRFNYVMSLIILAMIFQVVMVRYLHTAYRNGLHIGNQIVSNAYLLRSSSQSHTDDELSNRKQRSAGRRKVPRKKRVRQTRTLEWVAGGYRRARADAPSSDLSSDELLMPIDE